VPSLIETLARELERPRELPPRVINYINGYYGIDYDAIGAFLTGDLSKLEDDDIDLVLSPLFTPRLADQSAFAEVLGNASVPPDQWPMLIQELVNRPTRAQLVTPDGKSHAVNLREVTIERYVQRLRLEGRISEPVAQQLDRVLVEADRPTLKAIARRAVWEKAGAQNILVRYLSNAIDRGSYSLEDALALMDLVEGRKPVDLADLQARMAGWQEALRQQIEGTTGGRFFHSDIQLMHGGSRDQRHQDDQRMSAKERELAFLKRLQLILSD
jgi:hypothetical protein